MVKSYSTKISHVLRVVMIVLLGGTAVMGIGQWYKNRPGAAYRHLQAEVQRRLALRPSSDSLAATVEPLRLQADHDFYLDCQRRLGDLQRRKLSNRHWAAVRATEQDVVRELQRMQALYRDPAAYNLGGILKIALSDTTRTLRQRLERIAGLLPQSAGYYAAAKANLRRPDAERVVLAMQKQLWTLQFLQSELQDSLALVPLNASQRDSIFTQILLAKIAVKDFLAFCRSLQFEAQDENWQQRKKEDL